jgi:tRNA(Phe) wybutosine-synthesizing methylase Tyw3
MSGFDTFKKQTVENIFSGIDFSTKGYIDHLVTEIVRLINHHPDYCTTSSCSGRLVLFYNSQETKGVHWTFVNHGTCPVSSVLDAVEQQIEENSLLIMKVEPFIMHICCRTPEAAKQLHQWSTECGFRESGITLGEKRVMLAIRTTAFQMEMPIARNGKLLFPTDFLSLAVEEANEKLRLNFERIDRFVMMLKRNWQWPFLTVSPLSINSSAPHKPQTLNEILPPFHLNRYGAAATLLAIGEAENKITIPIVAGGQGQESELKSGRKTSTLYIGHKSSNRINFQLVKEASADNDPIKADVHSVMLSACDGQYLVVMGGRGSPQQLSNILQIYQRRRISPPMDAKKSKSQIPYPQFAPAEFVQSGDIPEARWGHIFIAVSDKKYFLMGGRNTTSILNNAYLLEITESETTLRCHWTRLHLQLCEETALQRCFAAATLIPHPHHCEIRPYLPYIAVHGGLFSLEEYFGRDDMVLIDLSNSLVLQPPVLKDASVGRLQRYGHSLTSIGGKSILLIGGVSDSLQSDPESSANVILDYGVDASESLIIRARSIPSSHGVFIDNDKTNPSEMSLMWPDGQARVHHSTVLDAATRANVQDRLFVFGGGMLSLAFGDHYCRSLLIEISYPRPESSLVLSPSSSKRADQIGSTRRKENHASLSANYEVVDTAQTQASLTTSAAVTTQGPYPIILVPSQLTKSMKSLLEKYRFLSKHVKISSFTLTEDMGDIEMFRIPVNMDEIQTGWNITAGATVFALPITADLMQVLSDSSIEKTSPEQMEFWTELSTLLSESRLYYMSQFLAKAAASHDNASNREHKSSGKKSRQEMNTELRRCLLEVSQSLATTDQEFAGISEAAWDNLPHKYEMVGDVMMIPEQSFRHADWIDMITRLEKKYPEDCLHQELEINHPFWKLIATVGNVSRIARKATIDERPMRESKVILLYQRRAASASTAKSTKPCICGEPNHERNIPGWVTLLENKLSFSFDITKVMFCSGNNTERMRFGRLPSHGEIVVDLYAGIGYFTVPLLAYGGVRHLYALEWNPNSIYALRHNLAFNGVSADRYTILFGDNRITSVEHNLVNLADRISLGLLPTSTDGWPLAVRALKPSGGVLHIHENVHQRDVESWELQTCDTFARLFAEAGKPMTVTVLHRECVKSYAPRVHHYVLDVQCHPVNNAEETRIENS